MTLEKAIKLLIDYEVPDHIIGHSYKVAKIVYYLAEELSSVSLLNFNKELALHSALLHDITKYQAILNKGEDHSYTGGQLMRKLGYPDIAEIIESHVIFRNIDYLKIEKELVFYADKRVKHEEIVTLEERFEDLKNRYGINDKVLDGFRVAKKIENKLKKSGIKVGLLHYLN